MAAIVQIHPGMRFEPITVSFTEAATPTAGDDSSGQLGTFTFTTPERVSSIDYRDYSSEETVFGPSILMGAECTIFDSEKGFASGTIEDVQVNRAAGTITASGMLRSGALSIYNVQAQPFVGTVDDAFRYYLGLAKITDKILVESDLAAKRVTFPGWHGELWHHLKQMAASLGAEIALVADTFILRTLGTQVVGSYEKSELTVGFGTPSLAQSVEIYYYNNRAITDRLVYPPGGWNSDVEVLTVNAEETEVYTLELNASISSFQAPVMKEFVANSHNSSSVYTIVTDDGLPVKPAQWAAYGGSLTIEIGEDTRSLVVTLRGARGVPLATGGTSRTFAVALGSDLTGNRYSTLRIVGTGVSFDKKLLTLPTGVPATMSGTDVGITIENPFLSSLEQAYQVGVPAARRFSGSVPSLTVSTPHLELEQATDFSLGTDFQTVRQGLQGDMGSGTNFTYENVKGHTEQEAGTPLTYRKDLDYWQDRTAPADINQTLGNIQGARIFEPSSRRWFRIREATIDPGMVTVSSADDDNTYADASYHWEGKTYLDLSSEVPLNFSYLNADMAGLFDGFN